MKMTEIIDVIENVAPLHLAAKWDNCGMQVASLKQDVNTIALCLDPSPESIESAIAIGAEFILSHHPLLMQGRLPSTVDHLHHAMRLLFKHNVALYAAHTSLDINPFGPVGWLGEKLNFQNAKVLEDVGELSNGQRAGYGLVGDLDKAMDYQQLLGLLKQYLDLNTATVCGVMPSKIRRVAYCTGSGSSLMQQAYSLGADIFITGDVKYHTALESPICTLDVGHHSLEEEMMRLFSVMLSEYLPKLQVHFVSSTSPLRQAVL